MKKSEIMKNNWLEAMADFVLENGLNSATIRPLANAADTSGRMLIYHFGTKEKLLSELLHYIDRRMERDVTQLLPEERARTREECVKSILTVLRTVEKSGFFRIWYEIVARASLGETLYINIAKSFSDTVTNWLIAHVPESEKNPLATARALSIIIEGISVMHIIQRQKYIEDAVNVLLKSDAS